MEEFFFSRARARGNIRNNKGTCHDDKEEIFHERVTDGDAAFSHFGSSRYASLVRGCICIYTEMERRGE